MPNAIYCTCVRIFTTNTIVVANNYFDKTLRNILGESRGALLFLTAEEESFQIKGTIEYHVDGPIFEDMKSWNPPKASRSWCGAEGRGSLQRSQ